MIFLKSESSKHPRHLKSGNMVPKSSPLDLDRETSFREIVIFFSMKLKKEERQFLLVLPIQFHYLELSLRKIQSALKLAKKM